MDNSKEATDSKTLVANNIAEKEALETKLEEMRQSLQDAKKSLLSRMALKDKQLELLEELKAHKEEVWRLEGFLKDYRQRKKNVPREMGRGKDIDNWIVAIRGVKDLLKKEKFRKKVVKKKLRNCKKEVEMDERVQSLRNSPKPCLVDEGRLREMKFPIPDTKTKGKKKKAVRPKVDNVHIRYT